MGTADSKVENGEYDLKNNFNIQDFELLTVK